MYTTRFLTGAFFRGPVYVAFIWLVVCEETAAQLGSTLRSTPLVRVEHAQCQMPACNRTRARIKPDIMIPFWQEDLCKLWYTARSIAVHDKSGHFGKVFLVWVSTHAAATYQSQVDQIIGILKENHDAEVLDFSGQVSASAAKGMGGWYAQQVLKLKIASKITSEFYVVMDAKNTIVRDIRADEFVDQCNRGLIFGRYRHDEIPSPHWQWYVSSAQALGLEVPTGGYWPPSITPMVIHKPTVLQMLARMNESASLDTICAGPLCRLLGAGTSTGNGATEFTLYVLYAISQDAPGCIHRLIVPKGHDLAERWSVSLWRGEANYEKNLRRCRLTAHAKGMKLPLMFGAQTSSLDNLTDAQADQVAAEIATVYERAGLHDTCVSREFLIKCAVGHKAVPPPIPPLREADACPDAMTQEKDQDYCCVVASNVSDICGTCWHTARTTVDIGWCGLSEVHCGTCGSTWCPAGHVKDFLAERRHDDSIPDHTTRLPCTLVATSSSTTTSMARAADKDLVPDNAIRPSLALAAKSSSIKNSTESAAQEQGHGQEDWKVSTTIEQVRLSTTTERLRVQVGTWRDQNVTAEGEITFTDNFSVISLASSAILVMVATRIYFYSSQRCCACCASRAAQPPYETLDVDRDEAVEQPDLPQLPPGLQMAIKDMRPPPDGNPPEQPSLSPLPFAEYRLVLV